MIRRFARDAAARFDQEIEQVSRAAGGGKAKDWPDYRRMVGQVQAYERAKQILVELLSLTEQEVDEADDILEGGEVGSERDGGGG